MKVLVTGDRNWGRDWDDREVLEAALASSGVSALVTGCARGADLMAERWASARGVPIEHHPADWARYGRAAGPVRNAEMLAARPGLVLAFHRDLGASLGTADMVRRALAAGLRVEVLPAAEGRCGACGAACEPGMHAHQACCRHPRAEAGPCLDCGARVGG